MSENNFVKLGDVAHECRLTWSGGQTDIPIVGLEHLVPGEIELSSWDSNIEHTFSKKFLKGQVLLGRRRVYLKKAVVAPCDGICSGDITVIESTGGILPELLPFVIQNDRFFDYAMQGSAGSLSPRVKWEHLKNYEFSLPPLAEQKVLADKLWAAYRLKESYKKLLAATEGMVKSQFIEMFKDELNHKSLCNICRPKQWPTIQTKDFTEDGYLVYGANGVIGHYSDYNHEFPTILMACRGASCGAINVSEPRSYITGNAMCLDDLSDEISFEFLVHFLSYYDYRTIITGGAQPQITFSSLQKVSVPIPSKEKQKLFVEIARQADKSGFELRKSIDAIDAVIKSLINS